MHEAQWLRETKRYYRRGLIVGFVSALGITLPIIFALIP